MRDCFVHPACFAEKKPPAVYRSHRTGGPVTLPLAGFSPAEMEGTFP